MAIHAPLPLPQGWLHPGLQVTRLRFIANPGISTGHNWSASLSYQALVEEKAKLAKARELETTRLRAQQERVQDLQAQRDELRAKR